jgi:hypothetical protein
MAARAAKTVDCLFVSTDSPKLKIIGQQYGARIIDRPPHLATGQTLGEDVFVHGYQMIRDKLRRDGKTVELMVLLFANAATITGAMIDQGVWTLRQHPDLDSAVTVSRYNMWSPLRARRIGTDGLLHPFVPFEVFGDPAMLSCDRDSQGDVWFADMGVSVVRPSCLESLKDGMLPQKWMGRRIYPLKQWGGCDVDYHWQVPMVEYWLRQHDVAGSSDSASPDQDMNEGDRDK